MTVIQRGTTGYPDALEALRQPPEQIHALGGLSLLEGAPARHVAIVGTRDASHYGIRVAAELAEAFAECGVVVVSGMARGIDAAAHRAALEAGGGTIAVLGTGPDVPYPASHRALHGEIVRRGLVMSEFEPGTPAFPGCFPRRNRIIAGLAGLTVVVEAPYKSGAINTATHALELGRHLAAVPGPIDAPRSAGCNLLLRDGAQVLTTVDDALALLGVARKGRLDVPELGYEEGRVWEALADGPSSPEGLAYRLGLSLRQVVENGGRLELRGLVYTNSAGELVRRRLSTSVSDVRPAGGSVCGGETTPQMDADRSAGATISAAQAEVK
ncbi:MAG: DNA-protecting protein DprA [Gemmatimonadetes bacterium]|nr:DNA-protecting protein DprA [Gemmatimonadota bacterium]MBI3568627.1 DNA-protecting protein DprA [Gemmatimonadota bacterium]